MNKNKPLLPKAAAPKTNTSTKKSSSKSKENSSKPQAEKTTEAGTMSFGGHLTELRKRLTRSFIVILLGFCIAFYFSEYLAEFIYQPLIKVLPEATNSSIIFTGVPEAFFTHMKIAFIASIFGVSPYIFFQLWSFIAPGLYDDEKKHIVPIAFCSALFFMCGGLFCYFIVFPNAFQFFMSYSKGPFKAMPSMSEYFSLTLQLLFAFGFIFEIPLFAYFLGKMGIITSAMMKKFRSYAIVICFILGAILTPPDIISQLLMAIPMLILYEASIVIVSLIEKNKVKANKEETKADSA